MNKHSPAPWKFRRHWYDPEYDPPEYPVDYKSTGYSENPAIIDANEETVVGCDEYNVFNGPNQAANVSLMLAAPDLLEALETILANYIRVLDTGSPLFTNVENFGDIIKARAAIKKAKGE